MVVVIDMGRELLPNAFGSEAGIHQPMGVEIVPPSPTTLDCVVEIAVVLPGSVKVIVDRVDHGFLADCSQPFFWPYQPMLKNSSPSDMNLSERSFFFRMGTWKEVLST